MAASGHGTHVEKLKERSMSSFANRDGGAIVRAMVEAIRQHKQELSDIDGLIGDGDHGINMDKGFQLCAAELTDGMTLSESLRLLGSTLMEKIGGAMGPLYGSLFRAMGRACAKTERIDAATFEAMLSAADQQVREVGECEVGDKTLLDVLSPAREAFAATIEQDRNFAEAMEAMATAADAGRLATTDMVAKKGRSSRLGERSRGVPDAGATSCCILLTTMAQEARKLLQ